MLFSHSCNTNPVSKTPDFFWDCQLKIRLTRRFWCCFWASVGSWTLWVWVAHRRFLKPAALSCSAAVAAAAAAAGATASVASATASKTWGWRRSSSSRRGAPNFDPQNFDPQIIETEFWSSDYWERILILRFMRLTKMLGSATASKMWGWQRSSSSRRGAPNFDPQIIETYFHAHLQIIETHFLKLAALCCSAADA